MKKHHLHVSFKFHCISSILTVSRIILSMFFSDLVVLLLIRDSRLLHFTCERNLVSSSFLNISNIYASYKNVNQGLFIEKYLLAYRCYSKEIRSLLKQCFKLRVVHNDKICPALSSFSRRNKSSRESNKLDFNIVILIHTIYEPIIPCYYALWLPHSHSVE